MKMLANIDQNLLQNEGLNAIYERLVHDKSGVLYRVRFVVVEISGQMRPQVISVEAVPSAPHILLANPKVAQPAPLSPRSFFSDVISPYISLDFLMSQPTRAPSWK